MRDKRTRDRLRRLPVSEGGGDGAFTSQPLAIKRTQPYAEEAHYESKATSDETNDYGLPAVVVESAPTELP